MCEGSGCKMIENKKVMAQNILRYMNLKEKSRNEVCKDLGLSYSTFSEWVSGKKYPRIDKIEIMANYFGCEKSDLIEEKTAEQLHMEKKNDILSDIILTLREDSELLDIVECITKLDADKRTAIKSLISAFSTSDK